jgi:hypothetical protein
MRLRRYGRWLRSQLHWWGQRRKLGFDEREIWDLDYSIIAFIYPRLKLFRQGNYGGAPLHPTELDGDGYVRSTTTEEWEGILDEMLDGFRIALDPAGIYPPLGEDMEKLKRSINLLHEWFFALWN